MLPPPGPAAPSALPPGLSPPALERVALFTPHTRALRLTAAVRWMQQQGCGLTAGSSLEPTAAVGETEAEEGCRDGGGGGLGRGALEQQQVTRVTGSVCSGPGTGTGGDERAGLQAGHKDSTAELRGGQLLPHGDFMPRGVGVRHEGAAGSGHRCVPRQPGGTGGATQGPQLQLGPGEAVRDEQDGGEASGAGVARGGGRVVMVSECAAGVKCGGDGERRGAVGRQGGPLADITRRLQRLRGLGEGGADPKAPRPGGQRVTGAVQD